MQTDHFGHNSSNLSTRILTRIGVHVALVGLVCLFIPAVARADLSFYLSSETLSWSDFNPLRSREVAPVIDLCGEWRYKAGDKTGTISVPSSYAGYEGKITFTKQFDIPDDWRDRTLSLTFFGISHQASFRLNGALLGSHQSSGAPFEILIPEQIVKFGSSNELVVEVDNRRATSTSLPLISSVFSPRNFGGITREVFLQALPSERISSLSVRETSASMSDRRSDVEDEANVEITFSLQLLVEGGPVALFVEIYDPEGNHLLRREVSIEGAQDKKLCEETVHAIISKPHRWKPGEPQLYLLTCSLSRGNQVLDQVQRSFGLRSYQWGNSSPSLLDGFRAEFGLLRGIVWVQQWAQSGISPSRRQLQADLELVQNLGVHLLRCAYGPPHPYVLNLCDSLGIALFVEIPLFGVSNPMLSRKAVQVAAINAMEDLQEMAHLHPCIIALGWGSEFSPSALSAGGVVDAWMENLPSAIPYYACSIGPVTNPAPLLIIAPSSQVGETSGAVIYDILASMGVSTGTQGDIAQARWISHELSRLPPGGSSFFVSYLADWMGDRPLIYNPIKRGPYYHAAGLTDDARRPRMAFFKLKDYLISGNVEAMDYPAGRSDESPWQFLVFGVFFSVLGLWMMRLDKLYRQNLHRSIAHSQRFISEIRDRRFLQGSQTLLLIILLCTGIGNLLASLGYSWRLEPGFSALMEHLVGSDTLLALLRRILWMPYQGFLFGTLVAFGAFLVMAAAIRIGSTRRAGRLTLVQSFYVLFWSGVPALLILPMSALYLRLQMFPVLHWVMIGVILWVSIWAYFRLINALSVAYRSGFRRPFLVGVGFPLLIVLIYLIRLQTTRQTLDYIGYFSTFFQLG